MVYGLVIGTSDADCGSAYLFDRIGNSWIQRTRVTGPSNGTGDNFNSKAFGYNVSLTQDGLKFTGGSLEDGCVFGLECGKVYYFTITP